MWEIVNFNKGKKFTVSIGLIVTILLSVVAFSITNAAGSASYSLSPSSGSHKKGTNFTVSITENSSDQINGVDAKLSYDSSKLQFVSASTNGSPFDFCTDKSGGNGRVSIVCVRLGSSVSGSQPVGNVTFKVLGGSGSTSINFSSDSHIVAVAGSQDVWNGSTSGGTYSLTSTTTSSSGGGSSSGGHERLKNITVKWRGDFIK